VLTIRQRVCTVRHVTQPTPRRGGALESGLAILEVLADHRRGLGVTEVAGALGLDKGNTHRLLHVLQERGYVEQDPLTRLYRTTAQVLALSGAVLRHLDLRTVAEPVCEDLLEATSESVHASQLVSSGVVYVLQRRAAFRVGVDTEVGTRPPLHCTATGKSVLAQLPAAQLDVLLPAEPFEHYTLRTHTTRAGLLRDLAEVRERGFAVDDEEFNPGVRCVAAPIFGMEGSVVGCLGVSGPVQRMGLDRLPEVAELVVRAAHDVTSGLGGRVPGETPTGASASPRDPEAVPAPTATGRH